MSILKWKCQYERQKELQNQRRLQERSGLSQQRTFYLQQIGYEIEIVTDLVHLYEGCDMSILKSYDGTSERRT